MSISTRRIGAVVACPTCGQDAVVPEHDDLEMPPAARPSPPPVEAIFPQSPPEPVRAEPLVPQPKYAAGKDENSLPVSTGAGAASDPADEGDDDEDEGFPRAASRFEEEELDLTAMVDVVFQLLIFFMVTASFSLQKTIEVPTPDQPKQGVAQALQPLEDLQDVSILVTIDDRNTVSVDDEAVNDWSDLPDKLRELMRRDHKSELILTAARNSTHRAVIAVVDAANEVGMQRIRMGSRGGGPVAAP